MVSHINSCSNMVESSSTGNGIALANCSRNTDLDLYKMILHSLTGCMYVAIIATWLAVGFVCLLHTMLLCIAINYIITSYLEKYMTLWMHDLHV